MFLKNYRKSRWLLGRLVSVAGLLILAVPGNALSSAPGADTGTDSAKISETATTPKTILGLSDVLHLALTNNPRIGSAYSAIRAQQGRMLQAGLLPNPSFSLGLENIGISNADFADEDLQASFLIGQRIELGGQRGLRQQVEHHQARLAQSDYEKVRLTIITETTIAFAEALAQQILLQLADEQTRVAQELLKAVQLQVLNGAVSSAEIPRAEVEVSLQAIETASRSRSLRAAFRRLASMWGEHSFSYSRLRGVLDSSQPLASLETFIALLGTSFKEERLTIDIDRAQSVIALEDSRRIPDLQLGMGPKYFAGSDIWGAQIGVEFSLPIFDRNQGGRLEARAEFDAIQDAGRDEKMIAYRELIRSYEDMSIAHHEAKILSDRVIPQARDAYTAMRREHREGAIELTSVLDAQRSLFLLESRLVEAQKAYRISLARAHLVVGGPATRDLKEKK
jgi:cobalt-zinc-cadmium efflux system outer membrane protein